MFWRNQYDTEENLDHYLENAKRTNYTYANSSSYRDTPIDTSQDVPCLMRNKIHRIDNNLECPLRKAEIMNKRNSSKFKTRLETPIMNREKKIPLNSSDRVLRSRNSLYSTEYNNLNTNSNNLEDQGIVEESEIDDEVRFNNRNTKQNKPLYRDHLNTNWFQKNMYGLSSEESDNVMPFVSGTISSDDQYDFETFKDSSTNNNQLTRRSKKNHNNSSNMNLKKSNVNNNPVSINELACSPAAFIYYFITSVFTFLQFLRISTQRFLRKLTNIRLIKNTFYFVLVLPVIMIWNTIRYWYRRLLSINSISKRSESRRTTSQTSSNITGVDIMNSIAKCVWIVFWAFIAFMFLVWLFTNINRANMRSIGNGISQVTNFGVQKLIKVPDRECMEPAMAISNSDTVVSQFLLSKRALFCIFSFPIRYFVNQPIDKNSTDSQNKVPPFNSDETVTKGASSDSEQLSKMQNILEDIQQRLITQELEMSQLKQNSNNRLTNVEKSQAVIESFKTIIESLQTDMKGLLSDIKLVTSVSSEQKTKYETVDKNLKSVKIDFENQINTMKIQILKLEKSISKYENSDSNVNNKIDDLRKDLNDVKGNLETELKFTQSLQTKQKEYMEQSEKIRNEMQYQLDMKLELARKEYVKIRDLFDLKMSSLESHIHNSTIAKTTCNSLDEVNMKLMDENLDEKIRLKLDHFAVNSSHFNSVINEKIKQTIYDQDNFKLPCAANTCRCLKACSLTSILPESTKSMTKEQCMRLHDVRQTIDDALRTFAADRIALPDFALESAGGTIASTRCTETYSDRAAILTLFGLPLLKLTNSPRTIIQPSHHPGDCWAMKGSYGSVIIQLSGLVNVTSISIDHIPKSLSPTGTILSAIKNFEIKALENDKDSIGHSLGNFTYDINSDPIQSFVTEPKETKYIELNVKSNYGNDEYTCIYRVRVHGNYV